MNRGQVRTCLGRHGVHGTNGPWRFTDDEPRVTLDTITRRDTPNPTLLSFIGNVNGRIGGSTEGEVSCVR